MAINLKITLLSVYAICAIPALGAEPSGTPDADANRSDWLKSDLPKGTTFIARDNGTFKACVPPVGMKKTPEFKSGCAAFLASMGKTAAMQPINQEKWILPSDYPASAAVMRSEGHSIAQLMVGVDGVPTSCKITLSSGFPDLDSAACNALMLRARFIPAKDRDGKPVAISYSRNVDWRVQ
ncbi:MAG: energy transducer TonB [Novosphingobium sp.]